MSLAPAHWSKHACQEVTDEVEKLLAGIDLPSDEIDTRRCAIIQACGHIAINLICDLASRLPDGREQKAVDSVQGIAALNKDMVAHVGRRFLQQ